MGSRLLYSIIFIFFFNNPIFSEESEPLRILNAIVREHPEAKSLFHSLHAHKSHTEATGIMPDPKIGVAYRNYPTRNGYSLNDRPLDTPTMTGIEFSLSQEFPFPGKLGSEQRISKFMETEAGWNFESGINRLLADALSKINRYQRTSIKKELNRKIADLLRAEKKVSEGYYSSGSSPLAEALKVSIAKTASMEKETEYSAILKDLSSQLEYFLVEDRVSFRDLSLFDMDSYFKEHASRILEFQNSVETSAAENPEYKLYLAEEKRLRESAKLSKLSLLPQTEVFVSYMKRRSQTFALDQGPLEYKVMDTTEYRGDLFSFGVNLRVPVWSALKWGSISGQYETEAESGKETARKIKLQVIAELNRNSELIRGYEKQIEILDRKLVPELEQAVRAASASYLSGKINFQELSSIQVEVWNAKIRKEDLLEKKNDSVINVLKILSLLYPHKDNPLHSDHTATAAGGRR
ncbi:TolC family protein [Leptospira ellisii]|uniref:TolC family protein n=2 Tax=Leptospira ellisii TaxID=2023197 RepID=A0AAE4QQK6_9LEPT|nr:TolC family protein [Leptospira ellisii]MDV6236957.1 TolC family protein [Leptospira ellisii]